MQCAVVWVQGLQHGHLELALRHRLIWQSREQENVAIRLVHWHLGLGEINEQVAFRESYCSGTYVQ